MTEDTMRWELSRLYPSTDSAEFDADLDAAQRRAASFAADYRGRVAALDAAAMATALERYETLAEAAAKPQHYAYLLFSSDSASDRHREIYQRAAEAENRTSQELMFFELELMETPEADFVRLCADPALERYRHFLKGVRRFRPHTLSEKEEKLLKLKSLTGTEAFTSLYDEVSASFRFRFELEGETREMSGEELLALLHHADAGVRERAFSLFLERHGENEAVYRSVFNTAILDHAQDLELRSFSHPMQPTNLANEIEDEVVERIMDVSEANYAMAREYFALKSRLLGMEKLKNSDLYAPIPGADRRYTFAEAKQAVLEAMESFSPRFREIAEGFFSGGRLDVLPRTGKSGGAFCMPITPRIPPFVLLNFTGDIRDVSTMAHELGHGIHFVLAQRQSMLNYGPPLTLAETASTFCEMVLASALERKESDLTARRSLLCAQIEDIIATTFRQNVLTRFEARIHLERKNGLLSSQALCDIWLEENAKLYGDAVEMIPPYRWGWTYISHFIHSRFYCYSYVFAELLVLSLFSKYRKEGSAFVPVFEEILASGGSRTPGDTLRPAGIDPARPEFWQEGYDLLGELIGELKEIMPE
ncbi:MAG TPA: M3 family oligoendopeptidase [Verrucomicrobiae bacterium]|nr:M3 family oligoendopeptidase [Verrucomicrobiae bacterium]